MCVLDEKMASLNMKFDYANAYGMRENQIPVFLRCQGVKGSLEIENSSSRSIDKIKIILKGTMMNSLGHHGDCALSWIPQRFVATDTILDLVEAHDWPTNGTITNTDDDKVASFSFDFPLHRRPSWDSPLQSMAASSYPIIPSSISVTGYGCRANNRFSCSATTQVRYELQAFCFDHDELVDTLVSTITMFDTEIPSPPPIFQAHFQGEFVTSKQKQLSKLALGGPKLTITLSEPTPLEIKPRAEGGVIMAAVPIRLCLQSDSKRAKKSPPQLGVGVVSVLRTSTYLSICKQNAHPTIAASQGSPYLAALSKHSGKRVRNLTIDGWQRDDSKETATTTWVREMTVLLPVVENCFPAPSFFTPFIARRYSLAVRLDVKSSWGDAQFRMTVPLQIVYPECPVNYEHIYNPHLVEEHTSSSDSPPIYIR